MPRPKTTETCGSISPETKKGCARKTGHAGLCSHGQERWAIDSESTQSIESPQNQESTQTPESPQSP